MRILLVLEMTLLLGTTQRRRGENLQNESIFVVAWDRVWESLDKEDPY